MFNERLFTEDDAVPVDDDGVFDLMIGRWIQLFRKKLFEHGAVLPQKIFSKLLILNNIRKNF